MQERATRIGKFVTMMFGLSFEKYLFLYQSSPLKTKAGTTYVNNELAALKKRVKVLESTVDKLQTQVEFYAKQLKRASE